MAVGVQKLSQSHSSQRQPQQFPAGQALLLIVPRNDLVLQACISGCALYSRITAECAEKSVCEERL